MLLLMQDVRDLPKLRLLQSRSGHLCIRAVSKKWYCARLSHVIKMDAATAAAAPAPVEGMEVAPVAVLVEIETIKFKVTPILKFLIDLSFA